MDTFIFSIIVLIISAIMHEMAHGYAADFLGDPTPRNQGRLSLNPLRHLDPIGSFLLPFFTYNIGGVIFGWARPVEFNPYNLRNPKRDEMIIAAAGPITNLLIAIVFGIIVRYSGNIGISIEMMNLVALVVVINLSLMVFNLIPIPPLDGSKIVLNLLSERFHGVKEWFVRNSLIVFVIFIFLGVRLITPIVEFLFKVITGYSI